MLLYNSQLSGNCYKVRLPVGALGGPSCAIPLLHDPAPRAGFRRTGQERREGR